MSDDETTGVPDVEPAARQAEVLAYIEALELRVSNGSATLEDFGELARARQELAGRRDAGR